MVSLRYDRAKAEQAAKELIRGIHADYQADNDVNWDNFYRDIDVTNRQGLVDHAKDFVQSNFGTTKTDAKKIKRALSWSYTRQDHDAWLRQKGYIEGVGDDGNLEISDDQYVMIYQDAQGTRATTKLEARVHDDYRDVSKARKAARWVKDAAPVARHIKPAHRDTQLIQFIAQAYNQAELDDPEPTPAAERYTTKEALYDSMSQVRSLGARRKAKGLVGLLEQEHAAAAENSAPRQKLVVKDQQGNNVDHNGADGWTREGFKSYAGTLFRSDLASLALDIGLIGTAFTGGLALGSVGAGAAQAAQSTAQLTAYGIGSRSLSLAGTSLKKSSHASVKTIGYALDYAAPVALMGSMYFSAEGLSKALVGFRTGSLGAMAGATIYSDHAENSSQKLKRKAQTTDDAAEKAELEGKAQAMKGRARNSRALAGYASDAMRAAFMLSIGNNVAKTAGCDMDSKASEYWDRLQEKVSDCEAKADEIEASAAEYVDSKTDSIRDKIGKRWAIWQGDRDPVPRDEYADAEVMAILKDAEDTLSGIFRDDVHQPDDLSTDYFDLVDKDGETYLVFNADGSKDVNQIITDFNKILERHDGFEGRIGLSDLIENNPGMELRAEKGPGSPAEALKIEGQVMLGEADEYINWDRYAASDKQWERTFETLNERFLQFWNKPDRVSISPVTGMITADNPYDNLGSFIDKLCTRFGADQELAERGLVSLNPTERLVSGKDIYLGTDEDPFLRSSPAFHWETPQPYDAETGQTDAISATAKDEDAALTTEDATYAPTIDSDVSSAAGHQTVSGSAADDAGSPGKAADAQTSSVKALDTVEADDIRYKVHISDYDNDGDNDLFLKVHRSIVGDYENLKAQVKYDGITIDRAFNEDGVAVFDNYKDFDDACITKLKWEKDGQYFSLDQDRSIDLTLESVAKEAPVDAREQVVPAEAGSETAGEEDSKQEYKQPAPEAVSAVSQHATVDNKPEKDPEGAAGSGPRTAYGQENHTIGPMYTDFQGEDLRVGIVTDSTSDELDQLGPDNYIRTERTADGRVKITNIFPLPPNSTDHAQHFTFVLGNEDGEISDPIRYEISPAAQEQPSAKLWDDENARLYFRIDKNMIDRESAVEPEAFSENFIDKYGEGIAEELKDALSLQTGTRFNKIDYLTLENTLGDELAHEIMAKDIDGERVLDLAKERFPNHWKDPRDVRLSDIIFHAHTNDELRFGVHGSLEPGDEFTLYQDGQEAQLVPKRNIGAIFGPRHR
ncbi:hypothetical protein GF351_05165, partial [Candidatus Woesearchaeota archaeon]|nr:hypothetical protein [Candidatus Woesearchaeota archaeon]